jgi:hypothetical protein
MIQNIRIQKITTMFLLLIFVFIFFILFIPINIGAQTILQLENAIVLTSSPTYPVPNKEVTLNAESFSIDLNNSTISWFVNENLEQQSIGGTSFKFINGELGDNKKINVIAEKNDVLLGTAETIIRPNDVDIIWQGNTFSHPLYEGRKLPSTGSTINIEAIPHFLDGDKNRIRASELTYTWKVDGKVLTSQSGRGKNTIIISQTKPTGSLYVELEIQSSDKKLYRREWITIPIQDGEVLIYESSPLLGDLFNKAISGLFTLKEQEARFVAYPFFMSLSGRNASHIDYSWKIDNTPILLGDDKGSIVVNQTNEKDSGEAQISVSIQNSRDIFQRNSGKFIIEFGNNSSSGFNF